MTHDAILDQSLDSEKKMEAASFSLNPVQSKEKGVMIGSGNDLVPVKRPIGHLGDGLRIRQNIVVQTINP